MSLNRTEYEKKFCVVVTPPQSRKPSNAINQESYLKNNTDPLTK